MKFTKFFALLGAAALAFAACDPVDNGGTNNGGTDDGGKLPTPTGNITLSADKTSIEVGEVVTFTVVDAENQDVTSQANIYDNDLNLVKDAKFTATTTGSFEFFATLGKENSNYLKITVMAEVPVLPENPEPENLAFNHRAVLVDHTGVNCGFCPDMIDKLNALHKTSWGTHYNEVTCHAGGYANGDPGNSPAANALNQFQSGMIDGYPCILVNFYGEPYSYGYNDIIKVLQNYVKKDGVDVGISLAVTGDEGCIYAAAQVKSGVAQEYKVTAWLLESQIYSPNQAGATKDYHRIYNNALRNMSHQYSKTNVQGDSYTLTANETRDFGFELPITSTKWNYQNMSVLVIVSAKDANGRWEVANSAVCKLNESKEFEYVK